MIAAEIGVRLIVRRRVDKIDLHTVRAIKIDKGVVLGSSADRIDLAKPERGAEVGHIVDLRTGTAHEHGTQGAVLRRHPTVRPKRSKLTWHSTLTWRPAITTVS